MSITIEQFIVGPMGNFCYFVKAQGSKEIVAIDPSWDPQAIYKKAKEVDREIKYILLTHTHFDHVMKLSELQKLTQSKVYVHAAEAGNLDVDKTSIVALEEGSVLNIAGLEFKCLHTPGHTQGSVCYMVGSYLFTGDTIFVDSCGRVDLPESDPELMVKSFARLSQLPSGTIVYPGHAYATSPCSTIGEQLKTNPCFKWRAKDLV